MQHHFSYKTENLTNRNRNIKNETEGPRDRPEESKSLCNLKSAPCSRSAIRGLAMPRKVSSLQNSLWPALLKHRAAEHEADLVRMLQALTRPQNASYMLGLYMPYKALQGLICKAFARPHKALYKSPCSGLASMQILRGACIGIL